MLTTNLEINVQSSYEVTITLLSYTMVHENRQEGEDKFIYNSISELYVSDTYDSEVGCGELLRPYLGRVPSSGVAVVGVGCMRNAGIHPNEERRRGWPCRRSNP